MLADARWNFEGSLDAMELATQTAQTRLQVERTRRAVEEARSLSGAAKRRGLPGRDGADFATDAKR
jgi:hypothetical protein